MSLIEKSHLDSALERHNESCDNTLSKMEFIDSKLNKHLQSCDDFLDNSLSLILFLKMYLLKNKFGPEITF